jgi:hypothetical protein
LNYHQLKSELSMEGIHLTTKEGWFWNMLHYVVMILTFGSNRRFKQGYITTIGPVIAVPSAWTIIGEIRPAHFCTIEHEKVHVRQFEMFGLGVSAWLGIIPMGIVYLLLPLPIGFAWGRWMLERAAYLRGLQCEIDQGMEPRIENAVEQMTSGKYGWTLFPFMRGYVRRWFQRGVDRYRLNLAA